jgi:pilus assembly protein Flp/PilA
MTLDTCTAGSYRDAALGSAGEIQRKGGPVTTMTSIYLAIMNFLNRDEEGQGLAEYALILALIAIIAIIALIFLGNQVSSVLSKVGNSI